MQDEDANRLVKEAIQNSIRNIMDTKVEILRNGLLSPEVEQGLTEATVILAKYSPDLPSILIFMFQLKAEYAPKMQAAHQEQLDKYGHLIGAHTAEQVEDFLKNLPRKEE